MIVNIMTVSNQLFAKQIIKFCNLYLAELLHFLPDLRLNAMIFVILP